eukprot:303213_1
MDSRVLLFAIRSVPRSRVYIIFGSNSDKHTTKLIDMMHQCFKCNKSIPSVEILFKHLEECSNQTESNVKEMPEIQQCPVKTEEPWDDPTQNSSDWQTMRKHSILPTNNNSSESKVDRESGTQSADSSLLTCQCELCDRKFLFEPQLSRHMTFAHKTCVVTVKVDLPTKLYHFEASTNTLRVYKQVYTCIICHLQHRSNRLLVEHIRLHLGEKPFKCNMCNERFSHTCFLDQHRKSKHTDIMHICAICSKICGSISSLAKHVKTHSEKTPDPIQCTLCNLSFQSKKNLKSHDKKVHNIRQETTTCSFCGKVFKSLSDMRRHEMSHTGVKPFKCASCGLRFRFEKSLKEHKCDNGAVLRC